MSIPTMQRRHYEYIAEVIRRLPVDDTTRRTVADAFCGRLVMTNGQFKPSVFLKACGVD